MSTKPKILIVEDEPIIANDIKFILTENGYECVGTTDNGSVAIDLAEKHRPDLVLMDIVLKGDVDGINAAYYILDRYNIPSIYITAYEDNLTLDYAKETKPLGYILKPFDNREVRVVVKMAMHRIELEKKLKESEDRYHRLTDNARDMIYRRSVPGGKYEYINKACEELTGYTQEEFYQSAHLYRKYVHPNWQRYLENEWNNLLGGDYTPLHEFQIIHKSGQVKWISKRNVLVKDDNGKVIAVECFASDITEQKNIESKLRRQSEEYRLIYDTIPAMIIVKDNDNKITRVNNKAASFLGRKANQLEEKYLDEFLPDYVAKYSEQDKNLFVNGKERIGVIEELKDSNGNVIEMRIDCYPLRDDKGEVEGLILMMQDITKEFTSGKALLGSEEKYRKLAENSPVAVVRINMKTQKHDFVNDEFIKQSGYTLEEYNKLTSEELYEIIHEEDRERLYKNYNEWSNSGFRGVYRIDYRIKSRNGKVIWLETFMYADNDESGKPEYINQICIDITERKSTELALKSSEARFRKLYDISPIGITMTKPFDKNFHYANKEFERQTGYKLEEYNNLSVEEMKEIIYEEDRESLNNTINNWMKNGSKDIVNLNYRIVNRMGRLVWLDTFMFAEFDEKGKVVSFYQIGIDVTARKESDKALKKSEEKFRNLYSNLPVGVARSRVSDNLYEDANDEFLRQIGYTLEEYNKLIKTKEWFLIVEEDRKKVEKSIKNWYENKCIGLCHVDTRIKNKNGDIIWLDTYTYAEFDTNGKMAYVNQIGIDITNLKKAELALRENEERYKAFIEQSSEGIYRVEYEEPIKINDSITNQIQGLLYNGYIAECNDSMAKMYGMKNRSELTGKRVSQLLDANDEQNIIMLKRFIENNYRVSNEESHEFDVDGYRVVFNNNAVGIVEQGKLVRMWGTQRDVTELKIAEDKIKEISEFRRVVNYFATSMLQQNTVDEVLWDVTQRCISELGFEECVIYLLDESGKYLVQRAAYGRKEQGRKIHNAVKLKIGEGIVGSVAKTGAAEIVNDTKIDKRYIVDDELRLSELTVPIVSEGKVIGVIDSENSQKNFFTEIHLNLLSTIASLCANKIVRAIAEEKIKNSLAEKEILLKEVHHRVKNNLQIVSSLLKLQASYIKDKKVAELFKESRNRVQSMSLIHQKLYQSKDLGNVNFEEYIELLISNLLHSFGLNKEKLPINIKAKGIKMSIDNAIPAGLIINELVTNSLKHGFKDISKGKIDISVEFDSVSNFYNICVKDNGTGLPPDIDVKNSPSFGLRLVSALTEQMKGNFEVRNNNGAEFCINIKSAEYKERA